MTTRHLPRPAALSPATPLLIAALLALVVAGCGDRKEAKGKKKFKKVFAEQPKVDYGAVKVDKPPEPAAKPKATADTWAAKTKLVVAEVQADLQKCRNEFMLPFQFNKMRRRDVTSWLSISDMDRVCRDGTKKKRGAYKRILWLSKEHIGKHPALDRWIALGMDLSESYRLMSLMTKKLGAPKIGLITDAAKASRDRIIKAGIAMDAAAREIAGWPDDLKPGDDPTVVAKPIEVDAYKKELAARYDFFLEDIDGAYKRFANESWQYPYMIKYKSYRLWPEIPTKLLQQDRARIAKVTGLTDKGKAELEAYLASIEGVLNAWKASGERYVKGKKKDTWTDKDPHLKPLLKAKAAWQKQRDKTLGKKG